METETQHQDVEIDFDVGEPIPGDKRAPWCVDTIWFATLKEAIEATDGV